MKKEIITQAKTDAENLLKQTNAKIENTIRQIKEAQAEKEKTKQIRQELEEFREKVKSPLNSPQGEFLANKKKKNNTKNKKTNEHSLSSGNSQGEVLEIGNQVRLKGQSAVGEILEIQGNNAVVAFGQLKSTVKLSKLEKISNNQLKKENRFSNLGKTVTDDVREKKLTFKSDIDVRGMRGDEALQAVTYFIDDALMVGVANVRILHGTGTGILRQLIRQYLSSVHGVKHFHDEHVQFGGAGITVVEFS